MTSHMWGLVSPEEKEIIRREGWQQSSFFFKSKIVFLVLWIRKRDVTAFIFLRRISLGHQEESFATPGKCNVDTSLCDRCQDADQRRSFTWMEYWDPPASYCDTENFYSATFCKILHPDTQSFRHPFMASQLNSHYSQDSFELLYSGPISVGVSSS